MMSPPIACPHAEPVPSKVGQPAPTDDERRTERHIDEVYHHAGGHAAERVAGSAQTGRADLLDHDQRDGGGDDPDIPRGEPGCFPLQAHGPGERLPQHNRGDCSYRRQSQAQHEGLPRGMSRVVPLPAAHESRDECQRPDADKRKQAGHDPQKVGHKRHGRQRLVPRQEPAGEEEIGIAHQEVQRFLSQHG
jgi:hypothetical protein